MKITRKYPIFLLLTTIGTSGAVFAALLGVLRNSIEKEITARGEATAQAFAMANGPLLLAEKKAQVDYNMASLGNDPSIVNAVVADHTGIIVASLDKGLLDTPLPEYLRNPETSTWVDPKNHAYHFRADIRYRDVNVGIFVLSLSRIPLEAAMGRATEYALWLVVGVAAVIALFSLLLVRRELRPIGEMSAVLGSISKGDFSRRVPVNRRDEFGELGAALNRMLVRAELFFHYVDKMVIERLVANPDLSRPGGREQDLSVIFGDMRGYTAMSNRRSANEVVAIVNTYFHLFIECIAHFGGVVDKTMGDAIMAIFERRDEEAAARFRQRSVMALCYMKAALRVFNLFLIENPDVGRRLNLEPREFGFAMATGSAIVGNIGSRRRMDYTVCGRVVNLASRLEGLTKRGEVIIDNFTRFDAEHLVRYRSLPPVQPKGFAASEKVIPHRVIAVTDEEAVKLRQFLRHLFAYAFVKEKLLPADVVHGEVHRWCTNAEKRLQDLAETTPVEYFFALADTETGMIDYDDAAANASKPGAKINGAVPAPHPVNQ